MYDHLFFFSASKMLSHHPENSHLKHAFFWQKHVRYNESLLRNAEMELSILHDEHKETQDLLRQMCAQHIWVTAEEHYIILQGCDTIAQQLEKTRDHIRLLKIRIDEQVCNIREQVICSQNTRNQLQNEQQAQLAFRPSGLYIWHRDTSISWRRFLKHIISLRSYQKRGNQIYRFGNEYLN